MSPSKRILQGRLCSNSQRQRLCSFNIRHDQHHRLQQHTTHVNQVTSQAYTIKHNLGVMEKTITLTHVSTAVLFEFMAYVVL